jgi:hypothetical protein
MSESTKYAVELTEVQQLERQFRLGLARKHEAEAYALVKKAEAQLQAANDYWENCCSDVRMLEEPN